MNSTAAKVGAFLVGLAVVFGAALGIGNAVGPVGPEGDRTESPAQDAGRDGKDMDGDS